MTTSEPASTFSVAVRVDGAAASVQRAAIAAVPGRFRSIDRMVADVVVVEPSDRGWPELVVDAVRDGFRGIMVADRTAAPAASARAALEHAAAAGVPVVLHTPFAATVAWQSALPELLTEAPRASILDSVVTWPGGDVDQPGAPRRALLGQLAVVRPLIQACGRLRTIQADARGYDVVSEDRQVTRLTGVAAPVRDSRLDIDLVAADWRWRIRFDAAAAALPVVIQRMDRHGVRQSSLRYESGARACWVALHEQLTGIVPVTVDVAYLADLALAERLFPV